VLSNNNRHEKFIRTIILIELILLEFELSKLGLAVEKTDANIKYARLKNTIHLICSVLKQLDGMNAIELTTMQMLISINTVNFSNRISYHV